MAAFLDPVAAGLRLALTLLAVMVLVSSVRLRPMVTHDLAFRANRLAWALVALAAIIRSFLRAAMLLQPGSVRETADRLTEIASTGLAVAAFILLLAARARVRGIDEQRVRVGMLANVAIVAGFIAAALA